MTTSTSSIQLEEVTIERQRTPSNATPKSKQEHVSFSHNVEDNRDNHSQISSHKKSSRFYKMMNGTYHVNTCCGEMELSMVKVLAIIGMVVNTVSFLVIAILICIAQSKEVNQDVEILNTRTNVYIHYVYINSYTLMAAYSGNTSYLSYYYAYKDVLHQELEELVAKLPKQVTSSFNDTNVNINDGYLQVVLAQAVKMVEVGNYTQAVALLTSDNYTSKELVYKAIMDAIMGYVLTSQREVQQDSLIDVSITLSIIGISVIVIVPIIIFVFCFAIKRDSLYLQRLKKAKAVALIDTMNNEKLRELFKQHCKKEYSLENFEFLTQVQEYKKLCEQVMELAQTLSDGESTSSSTVTPSTKSAPGTSLSVSDISKSISMDDIGNESVSSASSNNNRKKCPHHGKSIAELETALEEVETKKFTLASDIFRVFLNVNGEKSVNITKQDAENIKAELNMFQNHQIQALRDDLFEELENAVSIVMLDSHYRFKESIEFMKAMKIDKIKQLKERIKKKSDSKL